MKKAALFLTLSSCAAPSSGDVTAVYEGTGPGQSMTVEVDRAGNTRVTPKVGQAYSLWLRGENYTILQTPGSAIVDKSADMASVIGEVEGPDATRLRSVTTGAKITLVPRGTATVHGRTGTAYVARLASGWTDTRPMMVVSNDPKLSGLGTAIARHFAVGRSMVAKATRADAGSAEEFERVLKIGAPLRFYTMELVSVSHDPISPSRFQLPATPETREQILKRVRK